MNLWVVKPNKVECEEDLMRDKSGRKGEEWRCYDAMKKGFVINCLFLIPTFLLFVIVCFSLVLLSPFFFKIVVVCLIVVAAMLISIE